MRIGEWKIQCFLRNFKSDMLSVASPQMSLTFSWLEHLVGHVTFILVQSGMIKVSNKATAFGSSLVANAFLHQLGSWAVIRELTPQEAFSSYSVGKCYPSVLFRVAKHLTECNEGHTHWGTIWKTWCNWNPTNPIILWALTSSFCPGITMVVQT